MDVKKISRSQGRSVVAAAAYRAAAKIIDIKQNLEFDFSNKKGVVYSEIILPENAPEKYLDRSTLWNEIEAIEMRKDSRLAQEILIALPQELSLTDNIALAKQYCQKMFIEKGLAVDLNIHQEKADNPHAHILITTRPLDENGFGKKSEYLRQPHYVHEFRKTWQEIANDKLFELGLESRIDCRSLKDRGIDLTPNIHLGAKVYNALEQGYGDNFDKVANYIHITNQNADRIINNPEIALKKLSLDKAYFTELDIAKCANTYSTSLEQYHEVYNAIRTHPELRELGVNDFNIPMFTTVANLKQEAKFLENAAKLELSEGRHIYLEAIEQALNGKALLPTQLKAFEYVLDKGNLKAIVGYAGSGKSFLMNVCRQAFENSNLQIKGSAPTGIAAESLEKSSGIKSKTLDSWFMDWSNNKNILTKNDVFILDEAGMVSTEKITKLLEHVNDKGAKLVLVGDQEQCQPFGPGNPFRTIVNHLDNVAVLDTVFRQASNEMQTATKLFATGQTKEALNTYATLGCIHQSSSPNAAKAALIEAWAATSDKSSIILAHRNSDVTEFNKLARDIRIANKEIVNGNTFEVVNRKGVISTRNFAAGDKIYFLCNDKELNVKNGTLATIEKIKDHNFTVAIADTSGRKLTFDLKNYKNIDHGYAATIFKSQGVTVDKTYIYATPDIDRHLSYVACSRHRKNLEIFYNKIDFKDQSSLFNSLSKSQQKSLAIDFAMNKNINVSNELNTGINNYKNKISQELNIFNSINTNKNFAMSLEKITGWINGVIKHGNTKFIEIKNNIKSVLVEYSPDLLKFKSKEIKLEMNNDKSISNIRIDGDLIKNKSLSQQINRSNELER